MNASCKYVRSVDTFCQFWPIILSNGTPPDKKIMLYYNVIFKFYFKRLIQRSPDMLVNNLAILRIVINKLSASGKLGIDGLTSCGVPRT